MTREELQSTFTTRFPENKPPVSKQFAELAVAPEHFLEAARYLKEDPSMKMDYLFCETATDRKDGFHLIAHLTSTSLGHSAVLRTLLPDKNTASADSLSGVWRAAEFYEREIFDLFGIKFNNHPDLRRIFLEDDWQGYPLRKDYKDSFTLER